MLNIYDYIRLCVFIIATGILATRKTKTWILADILVSSGFGMWMLLGRPSPAGLFSEKLDPFHVYMLQCVGSYVLIPAILWFQCRKTRDSNVMRSIMLCRTMVIALFTMLDVINFYRFPKSFTSLHMYYTLGFGVLWLIASTYQMIHYGLPVLRYDYKMPINWYLKADLAVAGFLGLANFLVPSFVLGTQSMKTNDLHIHFDQSFGACILATCILSLLALGFKENKDKKAVLISRAVANLLILLCLICAATYRGLTVTTKDFLVTCVAFPLVMAPALGVYIHQERRHFTSSEGYFLRSHED